MEFDLYMKYHDLYMKYHDLYMKYYKKAHCVVSLPSIVNRSVTSTSSQKAE